MKDKGDFEEDSDEDSVESNEEYEIDEEEIKEEEKRPDEALSSMGKNVTFKLHKGAAGMGKEKRYKVDAGTGRVTRSGTSRTRSGSTFAATETLNIPSEKAKSILRNLEGSFANPEVTAALKKEELEESTEQDNIKTDDEDEHGEDNLSLLMKTVEHLYGDLALFSTDEIVKDKSDELAFVSEGQELLKLRSKLEGTHIVDRLEYVNGLSDINEIDKSTVLREIVQEIKDQLPQSYDEA